MCFYSRSLFHLTFVFYLLFQVLFAKIKPSMGFTICPAEHRLSSDTRWLMSLKFRILLRHHTFYHQSEMKVWTLLALKESCHTHTHTVWDVIKSLHPLQMLLNKFHSSGVLVVLNIFNMEISFQKKQLAELLQGTRQQMYFSIRIL